MMELVVDFTNLENRLRETSELLGDRMDMLLPDPVKARIGEARLYEAMRYSALSPGKRLRPFLVVSSAGIFGVGNTSSLQTAAAIEFIHAYSLIHDDLPAIDDDDTRRGRPSAHIQFDEATAILAGDALLTLAFEVLADMTTHADPMVRCELIQSLAKAAGPRGMVAGQMMDLVSETENLTMDEIAHLQRMKTGALFAISCEAGAILGKAAPRLRNALRGYAQDIGLAFQITDDILDYTKGRSPARARSETRENKSAGKPTFVTAMGLDKAKTHARMLTNQAIMHLEVFDKKADILRELARFVVERQR